MSAHTKRNARTEPGAGIETKPTSLERKPGRREVQGIRPDRNPAQCASSWPEPKEVATFRVLQKYWGRP